MRYKHVADLLQCVSSASLALLSITSPISYNLNNNNSSRNNSMRPQTSSASSLQSVSIEDKCLVSKAVFMLHLRCII